MTRKVALVMTLMMVALLTIPLLGLARGWGLGVSSEPMDISGGGFFADAYVDWNLLALEEIGELGLRPSFGIGPLPINPQVLFLDIMGVLHVRLGEIGCFVGIGPSFMLSTSFHWSDLDIAGIAGLDRISITESITMYVQIKIRGSRFFVSPGVGFAFGLR